MPLDTASRPVRRPRRDLLGLAVFLGLCFLVATVAGTSTPAHLDDRYQALAKSVLNPPNWVFAPVWTVLYVMIAVSGWLVWRRKGLQGAAIPLSLWLIQLGLNLFWPLLFFGLQWLTGSLVVILLLAVAIALTAHQFRTIDGRAALLLVPYLVWVTFAAYLTATIWWLN